MKNRKTRTPKALSKAQTTEKQKAHRNRTLETIITETPGKPYLDLTPLAESIIREQIQRKEGIDLALWTLNVRGKLKDGTPGQDNIDRRRTSMEFRSGSLKIRPSLRWSYETEDYFSIITVNMKK